MAKVTPKTVDQNYVAIRSKLGPSLGGSSVPAPPAPPPGIVIEEVDGDPSGRITTLQVDQDTSTSGFVLAITGTLAVLALAPIYLLLDGTRTMTGTLRMGNNDVLNLRDVLDMRDILTMRDIVSMDDIVVMDDIESMHDIVAMNDIVTMRWIQNVDEVSWTLGSGPSAAYPHDGAIHHSHESSPEQAAGGLALDTDRDQTQVYLGRKTIANAFNPSAGEATFFVGTPCVLVGSVSDGLMSVILTLGNSKLGILAVAAEDIFPGTDGQFVILGAMRMDTSAFAVGDTLWWDGSALTATEPPVDGSAFRARISSVLVADVDGWVYVQPDQPQFERKDEKGVAFGYAPLDSRAMIPAAHLPLSHHVALARSRARPERPSLANYFVFR